MNLICHECNCKKKKQNSVCHSDQTQNILVVQNANCNNCSGEDKAQICTLKECKSGHIIHARIIASEKTNAL